MENERDLFLVAIFTFLTIVSWVFFELVKTTKTTTVTTTVERILTPLSVNIDQEVLDNLAGRTVY